MSTVGFSADIHKVADNDKRMSLFLGMAFLFVWVVAINIGVQTVTPRWFQRQFDWLASEQIPPIFLSMAFASLIAAGCLWVFSGDGDKLFSIDASGITCSGLWRSCQLRWQDFELLERQVATLILHVKASAQAASGRKTVRFDISALDCSGSQLEALIVHYRPDLFQTTARTNVSQADRVAASRPGARTMTLQS